MKTTGWVLASGLLLAGAAGCSDNGAATSASSGGPTTSSSSSSAGGESGAGGQSVGSTASAGGQGGQSVGSTGSAGGGGAGGQGGQSVSSASSASSASGASGAGGAGGGAVDLLAPEVTALSLAGSSLLRTASFPVRIQAQDAGGLARVGYSLNGAAEIDLSVASPAVKFDGDVDLRPTRGANQVVVFAEDLAGHRTEVKLDASFTHWISAGGSHTGAVVNGHLYAWGRNNLTQLGLGAGDTVARLLPELIPALDNVTAIDFRQNQSLALRQDGALFVWGNNADGRLGLGAPATPDVVNRASPTQVASLSGVLAATFGYDHTLVLLEDGTVRAFGDNSLGQLGDGSLEDRHYPVEVSGLTDIIQVVGGSKHSLALKRDGTVWAWGRNLYGNLGQGLADADPHTTPLLVPGLAKVVHLASGRDHALAVLADGTVMGWGLNQNGQVGVGTSGDGTDVYSPTLLAPLHDVISVAADGNYGFALHADGTAVGWGQNFNGQLGIGPDDTSDRNAPDAPLALTGVIDLDPGATHAVALTSTGVSTWGWSTNGTLGRAALLNNWAYPVPAAVVIP
jgi:alpha-tubulin suppressor-like RCC1 family protein